MTSAFKNTTINDTGQLTLPVGTSAQRPKYKIETFTSNTTWTCPTDVTEVEVLVVGGGGSGGAIGGGGAGGLVYRSAFTVTPGSTYTVTVGAGGAAPTSTPWRGANGAGSVFGSLTAQGGGGAGGNQVGTYDAFSGGSGGGGGGDNGTAGAVGTGIAGQGYDGGTANTTGTNFGGGAGGGAGGKGGSASTVNIAGVGGPGLPYTISGAIAYYAGGGGAGAYSLGGAGTIGYGGIGGGGNGGTNGTNCTAGGTNTGGGGGGAGLNSSGNLQSNPAAGGSGVVIIRYIAKKEFTANTSWTVPTGVNEVEVLVVAGGGGGGGTAGGGQTPSGGGGGGGVLYRPNFAVSPGSTVTVTVGAGGAGAAASNGVSGSKGGNSAFGTLEANGGGGGGGSSAGSDGGSGGGGRNGAGGSGTTGQGYSGAFAAGSTNPAGGGGGAGGPGQRGDTQGSAVLGVIGGHGGPGLPSAITGTLKYYGGGGGGGGYGTVGGIGGIGGGGRGNPNASGNTSGQNANTNTGGGGGGAGSSNGGVGGNGGSGIVVIRYNPDTTAGIFDNTPTPNKIRFNTSTNKFDAPRLISSPRSDFDYPQITDGLALLLDAGSDKSYPKLNIIQVKCWTVTTAVRSANYTVQYSDDGTTWTTAFGGVMSATGTAGMITGSVTSGGSGTTGTGAWGGRRFWRYVEGSTVTGHHPRVSRIMLVDNAGTEYELVHYCQDNVSDSGTYIVGTVSTSVLGKTWYDLSGNNRHFHLNRMVSTNPDANTTSPGQFFVEAGPLSYFGINSNPIISHAITTQRQVPFVGPPSDQMGFTQEHTIISIIRAPGATINFNYHFALNPRDIGQEVSAWGQNGDGSIRFSSHILYGGDTFYYDFPGCCDAQNRVDWANGAGSSKTGGNITGGINMNASWANNVKMATWRCRRTDFPRKQFYREQTVEYSSQQREVGYAIYNRSDPGHLCTGFTAGRQYYFAMYDRALTDAELSTQWTYLQNRFRIS